MKGKRKSEENKKEKKGEGKYSFKETGLKRKEKLARKEERIAKWNEEKKREEMAKGKSEKDKGDIKREGKERGERKGCFE